jgi:ABC-type amino acid transport substrate-binding protein/two-component sensor histidine kinase/PAS domain-containing protein
MGKTQLRILTVLSLFVLSLPVSAMRNDTIWDKHKTVVIEGDWNFPPFEYQDEEGEPKGFNIDLLTTILNRLHLRYKIHLRKWHDALTDLKEGRADLVSMMYSNDRAKIYRYGAMIKYVPIYAVFRDKELKVASIQNLTDRNVIVERRAISDELLNQYHIPCKRHYVSNIGEGLKQLSEGYAEVSICDYETALYYLRKLDLNNLTMVDLGIMPQEYRFAGNNDELLFDISNELTEMKQDGTYNKVYDKWFHPRQLSRTSRTVYVVLGILFAVSLILYVFNYILRKKVRAAESMLLKKNESLTTALNAQNESNKKAGYAIRSANLALWEYDCIHKEFKSFNDELNNFMDDTHIDIALFERMIHPDDFPIFTERMDIIRKRVNKPFEVSIRARMNKDMDWGFYTITATPLEVDADTGLVNRFVGFRRDNTELVRLTNKLDDYAKRINYVLLSSNILTWFYDIATDILNVYTEGNKLYNSLTSAEYVERCEPEVRDAAREHFDKIKINELDSFRIQRKISFGKDKHANTYYTINGIPIRDTDGNITSFFGICNDITNLIETQNRLKEEKEKAQKADMLKSLFVANMSHEIRTPLNAIVGFSNLLDTVTNPDERAQCVEIINRNSDLLLNIVNDILDLSKMESGTMEIRNEELNLSDTIKHVYESLKNLSIRNQIDFTYSIPSDSCIISADRNRILQILTNFITNAFKYTESGYVKVGYACEDNGVKLYVEDSGAGIPEEYREVIFNRFEKLGSFKQGAGLGLSICKMIVDMYHGKIGVDSAVGKGSVFWAWLPLACKKKS